jgi:Flp pilus assembly protein TadB
MMLAVGSAIVAVILGWRLRPKPVARAAAQGRRVRQWPRVVFMGVVLVGIAILLSPLLGAAIAVGGGLGQRWWAVRRTALSTRQTVAAFPNALDLLVLSIRSGYLPAQAIVEIVPFLPVPLRPAFIEIDEAMRRGERFADALARLPALLGPVAQPLVDSLSAADRYGLPLAPVLERLALEARQQRRRDSDATARELPVRLAMPLVLCTLPSFVLLAIVPLLLGALSSLHT